MVFICALKYLAFAIWHFAYLLLSGYNRAQDGH